MPSSAAFVLHSSSNSSSKNDNNNMLKYSSDHDDSDSQNDDTNNQQSNFFTGKVVELDDNWTMKSSNNRNKFSKLSNQGEATFLETEPNEISFVNSNRQQVTSPEKSRSVNMIDNNQQSHDIHIFSPDEFDTDTRNISSIPKTNNAQQSSTRTKTKIIQSPIRTSTLPTNVEARRSISKNLIRSNSSSQSISRSPAQTKNKRQIPSSIVNKGIFRFPMPDDRKPEKRHTPLLEDDRNRITSSDDEDDGTYNLKENDLKLKLKEEKRHGKKTGELFNKLHENYEELLEKYAQAENTIDQLRFQPKVFGDNTPRSTASEHQIHFTQQSKVNLATLRSSGVYHSTTGSPFSSIRPVPSTTTTTTTPARKSTSPAYSGTVESIYFDEVVPEKTAVEEIATPETLKLDLLLGTKSLGDKMKTFLTLMDTNQLSLAEQKQVYESIREDYEKLLKSYEQNKHDLDFDADLNKELENMKQLLKEIVKKITENLLGKSPVDSVSDRQTQDESHSSRLSVRSSICNHGDLMDQYKKLLNTVNTNRTSPTKFVNNEFETDPKSNHQRPINNKQKPYVYISGDSDDEQQQQQSHGIKPIPYTRGIESTSVELDYIPSTSVKYHQHKIEGQTHNLKSKQKKIPNDSSLLIPNRYSNSRTNDYDSGIGTNNLTKLSYDSKLHTTTMDESHFQSLDDEQESISSSSHSSDSGSESPGSPYSKKFDDRSSYRRKPTGPSNSFRSDIQTDSFDLPPQSSSYKKRMHRSSHTWKPQKTSSSHRSRITPTHRSSSVATPSIEDFKIKSFRPSIIPQISSKINTKHRQIIPPTYRSSIFINQTHTNKGLYDKIDENLYLDRQTGIIYRYESNKTDKQTKTYYGPSSPTKLYRCAECGTVTTYHHRHHIESPSRRARTPSDDLGYESGYKKKHGRYRYIDYSSSSSDSDSDVSSSYLELSALNQAYNRAERIQYHSRCLSRYILRQIKLSLATL